MPDAVTLVQLSDSHILAGGARAHGVVDTAGALRRAAAAIRALVPRLGGIGAVVVTGDLADRGEPEAYTLFREATRELPAPLLAIPGNHDDRAAMRAALGLPGASDAPIEFAARLGPVRVVGLDATVPGEPFSRLGPGGLARLEAHLGPEEAPTALFLHHPPFATGIGHMDAQGLRDADALAASLTRQPCVALLACGHVHRAVAGRFASRQPPGADRARPAHAVRLDLRPDAPPEFDLEPGAVLVHRWTAAAGFVSHAVPVESGAGTAPVLPRGVSRRRRSGLRTYNTTCLGALGRHEQTPCETTASARVRQRLPNERRVMGGGGAAAA